MNDYLLSGIIDSGDVLAGYDSKLKERLMQVAQRICALHNLENNHTKLINIEGYLYRDIVRILKSCAEFVDEAHCDNYLREIDSIENGIFDIVPVELIIKDKKKLTLLFGKVHTPAGKKSYSGVLGSEDSETVKLVSDYRDFIENYNLDCPSSVMNFNDSIKKLSTNFRCINVSGFYGSLDSMNLPISLFFSGKGHQRMSSLSNTYLFTNIYFNRYKIISGPLAEKFIYEYRESTDISAHTKDKILALWLWGHDAGHFAVNDNFPADIEPKYRYIYEIFHELWSDLFSLCLLRCYALKFAGIKTDTILMVFLGEMLRYIRKDNFLYYPDSASAIILYKCLVDYGIISTDEILGIVKIDFEGFYDLIDNMLEEIGNLFSSGNTNGLVKFLERFGINNDLNNLDRMIEFEIQCNDIPQYISILKQ